MIYKGNRAHGQEAAHLEELGVSSFLFARIGGVERGESTRAGADNRSIRERYTNVLDYVLRGERN